MSEQRNGTKNALKSGFYTRELVMNAEEQSEFESLRVGLQRQFKPSSPMQLICFEQITCLWWKCKLALRLEARAMEPPSGVDPKNDDAGEQRQKVTLDHWIGTSKEDLRKGIRFLRNLRADVAENGLIHLERDGTYKDSVIKGFGQQFYESLIEWKDFNVSAILLAQHLDHHRRTFPSASDPLNAIVEAKVIPDPNLKWQMVVKLIDLHTQQLRDLLAAAASRQLTDIQSNICPRYFALASCDLREAVDWYLYLRAVKL